MELKAEKGRSNHLQFQYCSKNKCFQGSLSLMVKVGSQHLFENVWVSSLNAEAARGGENEIPSTTTPPPENTQSSTDESSVWNIQSAVKMFVWCQ
jgi:hypothetical protein